MVHCCTIFVFVRYRNFLPRAFAWYETFSLTLLETHGFINVTLKTKAPPPELCFTPGIFFTRITKTKIIYQKYEKFWSNIIRKQLLLNWAQLVAKWNYICYCTMFQTNLLQLLKKCLFYIIKGKMLKKSCLEKFCSNITSVLVC